MSDSVTPVDPAPVRRIRQLRRIWLTEGSRGISRRARTAMANLLTPTRVVMPVMPADVIAANLEQPFTPPPRTRTPGSAPVINWVTCPAAPRAGGHTTQYRIVNYLQAHGYANRVYLYDVNNVDQNYYKAILRSSYGFKGEIANVRDGMADADAVVATSWQTAYPVFNARCSGKRCYFVQDFEPAFHAAGTLSELARNTYRMGMHGITAGRWLAEKLRVEFGMEADHFDFGCDTEQYIRTCDVPRRGVGFYARPEAARRGFEMGVMALELFAANQPDIEIHLYGQRVEPLPFVFFNHGRVSPMELNSIYNRCFVGLSISVTNTSLVPHEMLAAGCIPVVNDAAHNQIVLDNPYVRYAALNPRSLAAAMESVLAIQDFEAHSRAAAASVKLTTWDGAGATVDGILRRVLQC